MRLLHLLGASVLGVHIVGMMERWHRLHEREANALRVVRDKRVLQQANLRGDLIRISWPILLHKDKLILRLDEGIRVDEQLFIELLAGSHAGFHDVDVHIRRVARKANHVFRQIEYLHRITHIEHVDFAVLRHRAAG